MKFSSLFLGAALMLATAACQQQAPLAGQLQDCVPGHVRRPNDGGWLCGGRVSRAGGE